MRRFSHGEVIIFGAITFVFCIMSIFVGGVVPSFLERRAIEGFLGVPLPQSARDLHYYRYQISTDLYEHYIYIKFSSSKEDYFDLMHRMNIPIHSSSDPSLRLLLPGHWKVIAKVSLEWWDPKLDIPNDTAMLYSGSDFIVAKYESEYVYIVIHRQIR